MGWELIVGQERLVGLKVGQEWRASWGEGLREESRARKCMSEKEGEWGDRVGKKGDWVGVGVRLKGW